MLSALMGGRWLTAGELGRAAGVAPATASEHLARLVARGLVHRRRSGRFSYFALGGEAVAEALEALARIATPPGDGPGQYGAAAKDAPAEPGEENSARAGSAGTRSSAAVEFRFARTCYDHLAGRLGVCLTDALVERGFLTTGTLDLTPAGEGWFGRLGVDVPALRALRRPLARPCLDWSERRDHLAGAAGAALAGALLARGWLARLDGTRAVRLTLRGREGLYRSLGLEIEKG